jgi:UDP-glucuronate 4-epimerase
MKRDFTYIDDIVEGIVRVIDKAPTPNENKYSMAKPPYRIYNIGNNNPITLRDFISAIEDACGQKASENLLSMQPGDVPMTYADINDFKFDFDFSPRISYEQGISNFVSWYISLSEDLK